MSFITSPGVIFPPLTAGGVAYGTGSQAKVNTAGILGQYLISGGAGVPTFTDLGTFTTVNCTNLVSSGTLSSSFTVTSGIAVPLRITNLGTGNSFLVEDSTNPDASPFLIDAAGNVGVGLAPTTKLQVYGAGTTAAFYTNGDASGSTALLQSSGGAAGDGGQILFGASFGVFAGIKGFLTNGTGPAGDLIFQTRATSGNVIERMRIDSVGNVGIGGTASAFSKTLIGGTLPTSSLVSQAVRITATIPSGSTTSATIFESIPITEAAAFTLSNLLHFSVNPQTFGAGSTVTNQQGFTAATTLTGATNNYGFLSNIAAAANRFNFYAAGTAINYFAGVVQTNAATAIPAGGTAGAGVTVSSTANFGLFFGSGAPTLSAAKGSLYLRSDGTTVNDRMYVNTNGSTTWTNVVTSA